MVDLPANLISGSRFLRIRSRNGTAAARSRRVWRRSGPATFSTNSHRDIAGWSRPANVGVHLGGIEKCYRDNIIGGPGPFVMVARDYNSFGRAMVKKLIAEIATAPAELRSASAGPQGRRP